MRTWIAIRGKSRARRRLLLGVILFALVLIALSRFELRLVMHGPDSTAAAYVALASNPTPVLREWMSDTSAQSLDASEKRSFIPVTSLPARALTAWRVAPHRTATFCPISKAVP